MSVINPNETSKSWQAAKREPAVQLYLSGVEGDSADLVNARVAGFPLSLNVLPVTDWIMTPLEARSSSIRGLSCVRTSARSGTRASYSWWRFVMETRYHLQMQNAKL